MKEDRAQNESRPFVTVTEDFYKHLVENSLGLICCHDFDGVLTLVNSAAAEAIGYDPAELVGRRLVEFLPVEFKPRFARYLHRVVTFGEAHGYLTLVRKSGETVTWVYRNNVYGSSGLVIGHAQDITWRLNVEARLRESSEEFRALFEEAPVAYHEIDCDGTVVRVNAAECELLGLSKHEILGRPVWELVAPEQREESRRDVRLKLLGELKASETFREYQRRDGRRLYLSIHDKAMRSATGTITGIRSTLLDITEQHRVETELRTLNSELDRRVSARTAELKLSNERLKEFVYAVSHDLQEPLRAIQGFGKLLNARYKTVLGSDGAEFVEYITSGASRMSSLLSDLLAYSRVLHDQSLSSELVALENALRIAEDNLWATIQETEADITHDELPSVNGNLNRLVQLFQNLLSNAIKYRSSYPPRIHISSELRGSEWLITVTDNGIGVRESDRNRIFEVFKRTADRSIPGSGVGLAICRAILEQHGGAIWVESAPGSGSMFRFTLPSRTDL